MLFSASRRLAVRTARVPPLLASRRAMGGGGGKDPGYKVFGLHLSTEQLVASLLTFYGGLIFYVTRPGKPKEEAPAAAAPPSTSSDVLSILDEGFDEWSKVPGNMEKWTESLNDIGKE